MSGPSVDKDGAAAEGSGAAASSAQKITVLGIGNTLMADDGVGVAVVEGLDLGAIKSGVQVVTGGTAGMALIKYFLESELVIVVDGIAAEAEPGSIFRFHPDEAGIMNLRSNNIHGMGLPYLVTSARMKGIDPEVLVFAVQVGNVMPRDCELTPAVAKAAVRVREMIMEELERRQESLAGDIRPKRTAVPDPD